ncbi:MAG TPA: EamA family transporter, partial [Comamonadaceae bacterium]|nr:EamA family transporter [Comamonadaceae bacterium]
MPSAAAAARSLSGVAFATLVTIAFVMGANHVAARLAFNDGVTVTTAVLFRSVVTALVVLAILRVYRVPLRADARQRRALLGVGLLVGAQSLCLYSAVARLPVALALLAFNSYPLWVALWARVCYGERADRRTLLAMPVMLLGLALALDVSGAASGMGAVDHWSQIGAGVAYALAAAAAFGLALVLTQHGTAGVDGRVRTAATMSLVGVMALVGVVAQG